MNSEQKQLFQRIQAFSLDKPDTQFTFSQRLAKENGWNSKYTERVIEEYRKFIFLAVVAGHIVTPSEQIDLVWHLHLTYTHSYWNEFCPDVLGKPLHHQPTEGGETESIKYHDLYNQTLASYLKFFGEQPPEDIWSSPENRFGKDLSFKQVNTEENWIIPKPSLSLIVTKIATKTNFLLKRQTIIVTSIFLSILILFGAALPVLANYNSFYWDFLNVTLDLQDNGDLLVTEEQKYVFNKDHSPKHYRFIKLDKVQEIKDVKVFEDNHLLPVETFTKDDEFWIKWQEYLKDTDTHTFTLKYRAIGAINNFNGADKLEWKAIFPKRNASINKTKIIINLPDILADKVLRYYTNGSQFKSSLIDDKTIEFNSLHPLFPENYSTVKVAFLGNPLNLNPINYFASDRVV